MHFVGFPDFLVKHLTPLIQAHNLRKLLDCVLCSCIEVGVEGLESLHIFFYSTPKSTRN